MRKVPADGVTLNEAARILSKLEHRRVTPAQIRAILVRGTTGRALEPRRIGQTRVYSAVDLAMVRLNLRLRAQGVSPLVARVIVANLSSEMIEHLIHGDPMALNIIGMRGIPAHPNSKELAGVAWVDLRDVWRGVEREIEATRRAQPDVWCWKWAEPQASGAVAS